MKAAIYEGLDRMTVREVPTPSPGENEVLVRVRSCAVCGSDIRIFHHGNSRVHPPAILGHEIAGEVVEAGRNVTKFRPGDRVALGADVPCGECVFCEAGIGNNCQVNYAMGYQFPGGFAEYVLLNRIVVDYGPVHRIPDGISFDEAALAEPLGCVLNALELSRVGLGDTVAVLGAGPLGCMVMEAVRLMGASRVILVQRSRPRLELARQFGPDVAICSSEEDPVARVLEETGGLGADVVVTANPSPESQQDAIAMAKNRARVNLFGGLPKGRSMVTLDTNVIHYKELFVHGAHGAMPVHHRKALDLIAAGRLDMTRYISHRFPLDRVAEAFAAAEGHLGMRVVVNP